MHKPKLVLNVLTTATQVYEVSYVVQSIAWAMNATLTTLNPMIGCHANLKLDNYDITVEENEKNRVYKHFYNLIDELCDEIKSTTASTLFSFFTKIIENPNNSQDFYKRLIYELFDGLGVKNVNGNGYSSIKSHIEMIHEAVKEFRIIEVSTSVDIFCNNKNSPSLEHSDIMRDSNLDLFTDIDFGMAYKNIEYEIQEKNKSILYDIVEVEPVYETVDIELEIPLKSHLKFFINGKKTHIALSLNVLKELISEVNKKKKSVKGLMNVNKNKLGQHEVVKIIKDTDDKENRKKNRR